jgi:transposase
VAAKVGISPSMLRAWRKEVHVGTSRSRAGQTNGSAPALPADQAAEISRLKRELDHTRMERDV